MKITDPDVRLALAITKAASKQTYTTIRFLVDRERDAEAFRVYAYFRPRNRHPRYHNVYFTGASTHPGTGMSTAMVSGRLSAERILDDFRFR